MEERMYRTETWSIYLAVVGFIAVFVSISPASTQEEPEPIEEPFCEAQNYNDICDIEDFEGMSLGSRGQSFTSPNGFYFDLYEGPGELRITDDLSDMGHELFFGCHKTAINLPTPRHYVTLRFNGKQSRVQFLAFDKNHNLLDTWDDSNNRAESITLGPNPNGKIKWVYMFHMDVGGDCDKQCLEPYLDDVKACDKVQP
jgi:hypothetical protein